MDDGNQQASKDAGDVAVQEITGESSPVKPRNFTDRRKRPTRLLSMYWLRGRRRGGRRDGETANVYVDRYKRSEWCLILGTLFCAIADAFMAIDFARAGGHEANPVMNALLGEGWVTVVVVKLAVTIVGLAYILMHIRFRRMRLYLVLVFGLSAALVLYQIGVRWALAT